jgi:predicted ATPase
MLTRLKVSGFKNLVDVDVSFGPFTCIAGPNGVGKSNLFDAIQFLSALAEKPIPQAAQEVRSDGAGGSDLRGLFQQWGRHRCDRMTFEVTMIVPKKGRDQFGQELAGRSNLLRYRLELAYREKHGSQGREPVEIVNEELSSLGLADAILTLGFPHARSWRESAAKAGRPRSFITTEPKKGKARAVRRYDDRGKLRSIVERGELSSRTVLSDSDSKDYATAALALREMRSWRLLHLEPRALRASDEFGAPSEVAADGSHLAAALNRIAHPHAGSNGAAPLLDTRVCARIANRLLELTGDVRAIQLDRDEKRELLTILATDRTGATFPVRQLSDGTLRLLALAILREDDRDGGVWCVEEPENGIDPGRIPALIQLLRDIAVDTDEAAGPGNPLRQVIVSTHSPAVVQSVPDDCLLLATPRHAARDGHPFRTVGFDYLDGTWRASGPEDPNAIRIGPLLRYLNPVPADDAAVGADAARPHRVRDRPDVRAAMGDPEPGA